MRVELEYEHGNFIDFDLQDINYFLGPNHTKKWKLYRGIKRFSTGKNLTELEEHVYGDDGIVIFCDGKKMKAKELPIYYLDCRESFLIHYHDNKGSLMAKDIQAMGESFELDRRIERINNEFLAFEIQLSKLFIDRYTHVQPTLRPISFADITKYFLQLSYFEGEEIYPVEMMDIEKLIDDYCQLLMNEIERTQKMTWLWISNPNAFMSKKIFSDFLEKLRACAMENRLLKIFILSEDYLELKYKENDLEATVLMYEDYQQVPTFKIFRESIERHYPDELNQSDEKIISQLFRVFPYIGKFKEERESIYLRDKDVVLLKVVDELLGFEYELNMQKDYSDLTILEEQYLMDE
ncbi:hypothetical protein CF160_02420 [Enterococcus pseudoavium]|nr:hypothetical protein CF160_02420 [Enterococcus pseudoavium]